MTPLATKIKQIIEGSYPEPMLDAGELREILGALKDVELLDGIQRQISSMGAESGSIKLQSRRADGLPIQHAFRCGKGKWRLSLRRAIDTSLERR